MPCERVAAAIQAQRPGHLAGRACPADLCGSAQRARRGLPGYPVADHVDEAARGTAAVQQRGRTLEDLDLFRDHAFQAHGVVLAQAGHIECGQPVLQDLHAVTAESADHRTAGARTEVRRTDPELLRQGFTDAAFDLPAQVVHQRLGVAGIRIHPVGALQQIQSALGLVAFGQHLRIT